MISGVHALLYTPEPDALRAFFRDVLDFGSVDAGQGWLIFALPPAELGIHPADAPGEIRSELYLMCDDLDATLRRLEEKGVARRGRSRTRGGGSSPPSRSRAEASWGCTSRGTRRRWTSHAESSRARGTYPGPPALPWCT
jgi:hypothetical protein